MGKREGGVELKVNYIFISFFIVLLHVFYFRGRKRSLEKKIIKKCGEYLSRDNNVLT